ncbi:Epi-isozizaene synthase [Fusarium austroafricanum]|uniref:Terpene synthase n=1 Tax=Fusarium austroafricanum TaxID=2364996 RepID=A0A8H4KU12_9HYPO|nr:Epi-isozizaene synthase [Fusarium austroafricanum]
MPENNAQQSERNETPKTRDELLSILRGQTVRVPDLAPMFAGWPYDKSPHLDTVDVKIFMMIQTHAVNDTVRSRLTKAQLSESLAGWYPYASSVKMEILTSFQVWMFIIDDLLDQYSIVEKFDYKKLQTLLVDCEEYVKKSLVISSSYATDALLSFQDRDAILSFEEYATAVCDLYGDNLPYRKRIAKEAIATLEAYRKEALNRRDAHLPSLEEYLDYRHASSCMMQVVANLEFANGLSLPEHVMESDEIKNLYEATVAVMWIVNDIVSLRKEIQEGFVENIVVLLADGNMQRGLDATIERLQGEINRVNRASEAAAARFAGESFERDIALLAKNCKNMCLANWFWRYCLHDITTDAEGGYVFTIDEIAEEESA